MDISSIDSFLRYYDRVYDRTISGAKLVPEELIDWSPAEGKFSFSDLIRHIPAIERFVFVETVFERPIAYPGHGKELADGKTDVLEYFEALHRKSVDLLQRLSDNDLSKRCATPDGGSIGISKWLRAMVEHQIHHRGQIFLMLGNLRSRSPADFWIDVGATARCQQA